MKPSEGKFIIFLHAPSPPFFCLDILQSPFHFNWAILKIEPPQQGKGGRQSRIDRFGQTCLRYFVFSLPKISAREPSWRKENKRSTQH